MATKNDAAVDYVDIEKNSRAAKVKTSLSIFVTEQKTLICAGKMRAVSTLGGGSKIWKAAPSVGDRCKANCLESTTEIIIFSCNQ